MTSWLSGVVLHLQEIEMVGSQDKLRAEDRETKKEHLWQIGPPKPVLVRSTAYGVRRTYVMYGVPTYIEFSGL